MHIAIAQSPGNLNGIKERINWAEKKIISVKNKKLDLIVFPELFTCGYNSGSYIKKNAENRYGKSFLIFSKLAKSFKIGISYGYAEKQGSKIYNSSQFIDSNGLSIHNHRKLILEASGYEAKYFASGNSIDVFKYKGFKIATLICYDAEFPETARIAATKGAELLLVPTALSDQWDWVAEKMIPTRAHENGVFLAYANHCGKEKKISYLGSSFITGPNGKDLRRLKNKEGVITAKLNFSEIKIAQSRLPYHKDIKKLKLKN
jgi:predicted amidohydrolase